MNLRAETLMQIMPQLSASRAARYIEPLRTAMREHGISAEPQRTAAFLAQIAHESGGLQFWSEIWGPTEQQRKYDPPHPLALKLGNTAPGDGFLYRGRGPSQLTGKANYRRAGNAIGVDLVEDPDLAASVDYGFAIAGWFWTEKSMNTLADKGDFVAITKAWNGGLTGLESRLKYHKAALQALSI